MPFDCFRWHRRRTTPSNTPSIATLDTEMDDCYLSGEADWKRLNFVTTATSNQSQQQHPLNTKPLIQLINNDDNDNDEPPPLAGLSALAQSNPPTMTLMEELMVDASSTHRNAAPLSVEQGSSDKKSRNGGMKKGFLLSSKKKPPASPQRKKIVTKPDYNIVTSSSSLSSSRNSLEFPHLQESIHRQEASLPSLALEWIQDKPHLMTALQDPSFTKALQTIQRDPSQAKKIFQQDPTMATLLQEFCRLMKDSSVQQQQQQQHQQDPEQHRVDKLLADPSIRAALLKPGIQQVMQECRTHPGQYLTHMTHPEFGPALRLLLQHGLLEIKK
jgi:hypothetical protein